MNRRQKIIVSVTGIFLVALILMGLTYAYFLTQINGNSNSTSISVTTADLKLTYGDNSAEIINNNNVRIQPVSELNDNNTLGSKTFDITNEGDDTEYVILIENVRVKDATTGEYTTFSTNDFVYDLKCVEVSNPLEYILKDEKKTFPLSDKVISEPLRINQGKIHSCNLKLWYKDSGLDQSNDMNKTLEAKINIEDPNRINPYSNNTNSLAYNIINNAMNVSNDEMNNGYAAYRSIPLTKPGEENNLSTEWLLSQSPDDYTALTGINSYYYRGNVQNNYIEFNNICWRIVRIEGDGSVKLTLAKEDLCSTITDSDTGSAFIGSGDYGYSGSGYANYENSQDITWSMKYKFNEWFNTNMSTVSRKLKATKICIGDTMTKYDDNGNKLTDSEASGLGYWNYENYNRLHTNKTALLTCAAKGLSVSSYQIYPLTADEVVFAGGNISKFSSYYLIDNASGGSWLTLSTSLRYVDGDRVFSVMKHGQIDDFDNRLGYIGGGAMLRPAISLIEGIELASNSGDGTKNNPYRVVES